MRVGYDNSSARDQGVTESLNSINETAPGAEGLVASGLWTAGRPRVLQVVPSLEPGGGGVERSTIDIAWAIREAGGTAVVASSGGQRLHELERVGAMHLQMPVASKNPLVMRANVERLTRAIDQYGIDIVHARSRAPAWSSLAAAHRKGCGFVTTFHGTYGGRNAMKRWYNSVMVRGDVVIANSRFTAQHIRENYKVDAARLRLIPRGVDTDVFNPSAVSPERLIQLARQWSLPDGMPVIMLPGRLARWKGHAVLIDALAQLGGGEVRCLLVGNDKGRTRYKRELESRIAARQLESVVHITGHCADMPAAYMLADIVVSASTEPEAFGRVVAEAQAMGRPVAVSAHGGAIEQIKNHETGWGFTPGDPGTLAASLRRALSLNAAARERLARTAVEHVHALYTKEAMCGATLAVYAELVAGTVSAGPANAGTATAVSA